MIKLASSFALITSLLAPCLLNSRLIAKEQIHFVSLTEFGGKKLFYSENLSPEEIQIVKDRSFVVGLKAAASAAASSAASASAIA